MAAMPRKYRLPLASTYSASGLLPAGISSVPHPKSWDPTSHIQSGNSAHRPPSPCSLLCPAFPVQSQLPLRFTHRVHHTSSPWGGGGSRGAEVCSSSQSSRGQEAKWGRLVATRLTGPSSSTPPSAGCLTSLTYFPFPFREHVQQSQEHGKVSVIAPPHLIAIPPSLNASPRLPLWQHLLTSLRQEASPGCMAPSCFQGLSFGVESGGREASMSESRAAGPGLLFRAKTSGGRSGSCILWLFLVTDCSSASFSF